MQGSFYFWCSIYLSFKTICIVGKEKERERWLYPHSEEWDNSTKTLIKIFSFWNDWLLPRRDIFIYSAHPEVILEGSKIILQNEITYQQEEILTVIRGKKLSFHPFLDGSWYPRHLIYVVSFKYCNRDFPSN